jgi:AcrR family transcriptional regulator
LTATELEASRSGRRAKLPRRPFYAYAKLKPGPGRSEDEVFASQRVRLRRAMIELCAERGYEDVTVRSMTRLAGVSTRTFYKHFANAEECFVDTYQSLMQTGLRRAYAAQRGIEDWEPAIRASLRTPLKDLAGDPKAGRLLLTEAFALGPSMQARMKKEIAGFEQLLVDSFAGAPEGFAPRHDIAAGIAAGVMRVARTRLAAGREAELASVADELCDWALSFPSLCAPALEAIERSPFGSGARRNGNGNGAREDPAAAVLGGPGNEEGRILSAAAKLGAANGFAMLTVPKVRAEAGVSRRNFDARFANVGECFLAAIEALVVSAAACADKTARETSSWERWVCAGLESLCAQAAQHPQLARLTMVEIFAPGREGLERRERLVSLGAEQLRAAAPADRRPTELVAEASVAAAWRIAHAEIAAGRPGDVGRLAPVLAYVILAPTIGPPAAAEAIGAKSRPALSKRG